LVRRRRNQRGGNIFRQVGKFLGKANRFLKKHKVLSRGIKTFGGILPKQYRAPAITAGKLAKQLGYGVVVTGGGRRRTHRTRRRRR
jgi:hypothetical protein